MRRVDNALDPFTAMWRDTEASIIDRFFRLFISRQVGQLRHRRRQQERIHQDLETLLKVTQERLPSLLMQAYDVGRRITATALDEPVSSFTEIDRGSLHLLERNLVEMLDQSVNSVSRHIDDVFRRLGLETSRNLAAQGTKDTPSRFANELAKEGITVFHDSLGRSWSIARYTEVAMKSITTEAVAVATENSMKTRGLDIVEISHSDDPCETCLPFNGRTYSLSGRSERFPGLNVKFPIHPMCEHFMFPKYASPEKQVGEGLKFQLVR